MMKARLAAKTLLAVAALAVVACDDDDDPTGGGPVTETYTAALTGAAERPTPVTTTATGTAGLTASISSAGNLTSVTYSVNVTDLIGGATNAHIHGPAGVDEAAGILVPLTVTGTGTSGNIISGSFTTTGNAAVSMDSLLVLLRNGNAYVNVHTAANPDGEIRGQIARSQ
jgi:hypothetical protein